jgi:hypothetical protein
VNLTTHSHLVPRLRIRGSVPPLSQYVLMAWYLVKHRDNFTLLYEILAVCRRTFIKLVASRNCHISLIVSKLFVCNDLGCRGSSVISVGCSHGGEGLGVDLLGLYHRFLRILLPPTSG